MDLDNFIKQITEQFDNNGSQFDAVSQFKESTEYSSLVALSIITMIDEEYGITISGDDMKRVSTIGELYQLVISKQN